MDKDKVLDDIFNMNITTFNMFKLVNLYFIFYLLFFQNRE